MKLPKLKEDDRNLVILGVRAGFAPELACWLSGVSEGDLEAWLSQGRADGEKETEAAEFAKTYDSAVQDASRTHVLAANALREAVRSDPNAAMRHLRELEASRDLERARELTAGT